MPYKKFIIFPDDPEAYSIRNQILASADKIVIKVGTRLFSEIKNISNIISGIARLRQKGRKIILVSSGAVGMGMKMVGWKTRPKKLSYVQALAAIGQSRLMGIYEKECQKYGFHAAQLLLTADGLCDRERHLNALNSIHSLWAIEALPIVNENDSIAVDELKFGDNDRLAALIAVMCRVNLTIILTTVDGLYSEGPGKPESRISVVKKVSKEIKKLAGGTDDFHLSIGGMFSKIEAAEIVTSAGDALWIADGRIPFIIDSIFESKDTGTLFIPDNTKKQMQSRKRWLNFFSPPKGSIIVDDGAVKAVKEKGRSLLPSGIIAVGGRFKRGDTVEIFTPDGILIGKGLSNYSSEEIEKIKGKQTSEIEHILNYIADEEVIHRNNMVINKT